MQDELVYQFSFTLEQARVLWECVQTAPMPRSRTDSVAASFMEQLNAQSTAYNERVKASANGHAAETVQ